MFNYLKRFSLSAILVILLALFTMVNPYTSLDMLAFLVIVFILLQKIFGEYFILILLAARPALDYWRDFSLFSFRTFDFNINAALSALLFLWSIFFFWKNREFLKKIPAAAPWILFILWCAFTIIYSFDVSSTIRETMKAANLFALFGISCILAAKDREGFKKKTYFALIAAAVIPLALALYQLFAKTGLNIDGVPNRIYGTFAHPNILSTFALLMLMVLIYETISKKGKPGAGNVIIGIFLLAIIALTYTRIAWIGTALFLTLIGLIFYRKIVLYALAGVALFYLIFYPLNAFIIENFNFNLQSYSLIARLTSRNEEADSITWRADVANKVMPLFWQRPLQGYGYGSFAKVWEDNKGVKNIWDNTSEAHNDYLKVGFEAGIIGLGLYLLIFASLIYRQIKYGLKNHWINIVFISSLLVYLVLSASDNMLHHTPVIWWMWAMWGVWSAEKTIS